MNTVAKGLQEFLSEDKSLIEKITYDKFQPKNYQQNLNDGINNVYKMYRELVKKLNN